VDRENDEYHGRPHREQETQQQMKFSSDENQVETQGFKQKQDQEYIVYTLKAGCHSGTISELDQHGEKYDNIQEY